MGKILCATRGGKASIPTQEAAIKKAKESGDSLTFFYVFDLEFMAHANYAIRTDVVSEEMDKMVRFLLTIAVERAEAAGVIAQTAIAHGQLEENLIKAVIENETTLLVMGTPDPETANLERQRLDSLIHNIQEATGVHVMLVEQSGHTEEL
jgi:nucleotide-binding universal stress UspA family protein